jgi:hypothetical protein
MLRRQELEKLRLKCARVLSHFKKKLIHVGDDQQIRRLLTLTSRIDEEIHAIDNVNDEKLIDGLYEELEIVSSERLVKSIQKELDNMDKEAWYASNFENWKQMPIRQDCEHYPLRQRLEYSQCRTQMFEHVEDEWKHSTFPTLAPRLEFF